MTSDETAHDFEFDAKSGNLGWKRSSRREPIEAEVSRLLGWTCHSVEVKGRNVRHSEEKCQGPNHFAFITGRSAISRTLVSRRLHFFLRRKYSISSF